MGGFGGSVVPIFWAVRGEGCPITNLTDISNKLVIGMGVTRCNLNPIREVYG